MALQFIPMHENTAGEFRTGGKDAYGNLPEKLIFDGTGIPCRRCLNLVAAGQPYLLVAWRPFQSSHPFAETGPVFLHADDCSPETNTSLQPKMLESPDYILRGYDEDERIVYGTGGVIPTEEIQNRVNELLDQPRVVSVHIRSSRNNCYQCRAIRT